MFRLCFTLCMAVSRSVWLFHALYDTFMLCMVVSRSERLFHALYGYFTLCVTDPCIDATPPEKEATRVIMCINIILGKRGPKSLPVQVVRSCTQYLREHAFCKTEILPAVRAHSFPGSAPVCCRTARPPASRKSRKSAHMSRKKLDMQLDMRRD
jgi:hypothetical protein